MANPNIVNVTVINGKTALADITTTAGTLVANPSDSNKIFKLNALIISNVDGTASATVNIDIYRSGVAYHIARTVAVPANSSIEALSKPVYLEEGDELRVTASADGDLQAVCSYEEIS